MQNLNSPYSPQDIDQKDINRIIDQKDINRIYDLLDSGIRVDWQIKQLIEQGLTDEKWRSLINPASMDVTIGQYIKLLIDEENYYQTQFKRLIQLGTSIDDSDVDEAGNRFVDIDLDLEIFQFCEGDRILAMTEQYFKFPSTISGEVRLKSSRGREFYEHLEAGWIDPGFEGNLTLELVNLSFVSLPLHKGLKIGQVVFHRHAACRHPYNGKYKGDRIVSMSKDVVS